MNKSEFLQRLGEALQGEVPSNVYQENMRYYENYISQEVRSGKTEEEVTDSMGDPRLIAKTIIESSQAAGNTGGSGAYYEEKRSDYGSQSGPKESGNLHYVDLNKWYWKILGIVIVLGFFLLITTLVSGLFSLVIRFAGPFLILYLVFMFIRNLRR